MKGEIRVGRCLNASLKGVTPYYDNFENIIVLTKSSKYGALGPYVLKNEEGQIMENIWQFSKIYQEVPKSVQYYSQWDKTVIWDHPKETHLDKEGNILSKYYIWRGKGFNNDYAVRYPVGRTWRNKCIGSIKDIGYIGDLENKNIYDYDLHLLDYIESRKQIYIPVYCELARKETLYKLLQKKLEKGINLLIIEVDGPHEESLDYYKKEYGVKDDFIENNTMLVTEENLKIMLNDKKHAFGHGYCLAAALLNLDKKT